jgi:diaminopimelate decarboxylase
MSVLPPLLLPDTARIDGGRVSVGGCDLETLATEFGTPLFVYDEDHLRSRCREAITAFDGRAVYATKAFLCKAMAALAHEEGMYLDVSTGGESYVALNAGVPHERLVLHGNNKSHTELLGAIDGGVARVVVDSHDELDRIGRVIAEEGHRPPRVLLRVTPGVEAHTHEFVRTGQDDTKFGFGLSSGAAAEAVERCRRSSSVELVGLHAHIGSQIFEAESFEEEVGALAPFVRETGLPELSVGGGLGVPYVEGESAPTIAEWGDSVHRACRAERIDAEIWAEPGRAIVASAAVTLYTVGTIKDLPGIRTYVSVDGGMSDNPRPVLYGSGYETFLPRAGDAERPRRFSLVGKHCESGDFLVRDASAPADLRVGDVIATPVTGAYGHSMGSNYNKVPRPPVVFVRDGNARVVVQRETEADLLRNDL